MVDRQAEILAWIGRKSLQGELPTEVEGLLKALVEAGFEPAIIQEALSAAGVGDGAKAQAASRAGRGIKITQLTDDATRFLNSLRDLAYLDDDLEDEVLDRVVEEGVEPVTLDVVRRHVATVLFDRQYDLDPDTLRLLEEEWRLVFH